MIKIVFYLFLSTWAIAGGPYAKNFDPYAIQTTGTFTLTGSYDFSGASLFNLPSAFEVGGNLPNTASGAVVETSTRTLPSIGGVFTPESYGAFGNGGSVADAAITSGQYMLTSATAGFSSIHIGAPITVYGAGVSGGNLTTTIVSVTNSTTVVLAASAGTTVSSAKADFGHDDTSAIQSAITAASAPGVNGTVLLAANKMYRITSTLDIDAPMNFRGGGSQATNGSLSLSGFSCNYPNVAPYVTGSVLLMTGSAQDAIYVLTTPISSTVNFSDFAIRFGEAVKWSNTGDGIHCDAQSYTGGGYEQGEQYVECRNIKVYGVDGNHYAFYLLNPLYALLQGLYSWGGGGLCMEVNCTPQPYCGNVSLNETNFNLFVPGTAQGIYIKATNGNPSYISMVRTQAEKLNGPSGLEPSAAQSTLVMSGFTSRQTANFTTGSAVLTNVTDANIVLPGQLVTGDGIPSSTTVVSVSGTSITLSNPVTLTGTAYAVTFVPFNNQKCQEYALVESQFEDISANRTAAYLSTEVPGAILSGAEFIPNPPFVSLGRPIYIGPYALQGTPLLVSDGFSFGESNQADAMIRLVDIPSDSTADGAPFFEGFGCPSASGSDFYRSGSGGYFRWENITSTDGITFTYPTNPTMLLTLGGDLTEYTGNIIVDGLGKGFQVEEGSNAKQGIATLSGGTVTVSNTSVTSNSRIFLTEQSLGTITIPAQVAVTSRTPGTSFTITSSAPTDTSVVAYEIFEPAP